MTDQDKAHIVAEWCGWEIRWVDSGCIPNWEVISPNGRIVARYQIESTCMGSLPCYDTLNACAEFEKMAKERGLEDEYEHAIIAACGKPVGTRSYAARPFDTVTATPAQRVEAILAVIEGTKS